MKSRIYAKLRLHNFTNLLVYVLHEQVLSRHGFPVRGRGSEFRLCEARKFFGPEHLWARPPGPILAGLNPTAPKVHSSKP